jgi:hypothetical protein
VVISGKPTQNKARRNHTPGGKPPRVENIVQVKKTTSFLKFLGTMEVVKCDPHNNDENSELLHEQPTVHDQTWNNKILCQSIFLKIKQEGANGHLIFYV